ncbi:hypothetical protein D3C81_1606830 [compost metagenome]
MRIRASCSIPPPKPNPGVLNIPGYSRSARSCRTTTGPEPIRYSALRLPGLRSQPSFQYGKTPHCSQQTRLPHWRARNASPPLDIVVGFRTVAGPRAHRKKPSGCDEREKIDAAPAIRRAQPVTHISPTFYPQVFPTSSPCKPPASALSCTPVAADPYMLWLATETGHKKKTYSRAETRLLRFYSSSFQQY